MSKANPKTHKDLVVSRVPLEIVKRLERDARKDARSTAYVIRQILTQHYGLLKQAS